MENEKSISTSQPALGDIINMWNDIFDAGYDEIIYIPMSSSLSGSYHSALLLAEDFDSKVHVIDNHRISATQLQSVLDAKKMADNGMSVAEIEQYLNNTSFQSSIYLTAATLKYLQMGGRLSSSAALLGNVLNIKPILTIVVLTAGSLRNSEDIEHCLEQMRSAFPNYDVYYSTLPCSIVCHIGPDCLGMGISVCCL